MMQRELTSDYAFHVFLDGEPPRRIGTTSDDGDDGKPRAVSVPARGWFVRPVDLDLGARELPELVDALIAAGITALSLAGCRLVDDAALALLMRVPALEMLDLFNTSVTDAGLAALAGLPRLRTLSLAGTRITDGGVRTLASLPLEALDLGWTDIGDAAIEPLGSCRSLRVLSLRATRVSDRGMPAIAGLALRSLDLQETDITDDGVAALRPLAGTLEQLQLGYTRVSDGCVEHLAALAGLRTLMIRATRISADRDRALAGALSSLGSNHARGIVR